MDLPTPPEVQVQQRNNQNGRDGKKEEEVQGKVGYPFYLKKVQNDGDVVEWAPIPAAVTAWQEYYTPIVSGWDAFTFPPEPAVLRADLQKPSQILEDRLKLLDTAFSKWKAAPNQNSVPPSLVREGGTLTLEQRRFAKLLYISDGGWNNDSVRLCLPINYCDNPAYSYQENNFRAAMAKTASKIHAKIFTPKLRTWVGHQIFLNFVEFQKIVHLPHERREYFAQRMGLASIYWTWKNAIGDVLNCEYIFSRGQRQGQEEVMREKMLNRLVLLAAYAADSILIYEFNKNENADHNNRRKMMDGFKNIWRQDSFLDENTIVAWKEWAVVDQISSANQGQSFEHTEATLGNKEDDDVFISLKRRG